MAEPKPELYSIQQAADFLGVTRRTIERWIRTGRLPAYKIAPNRRRVAYSDLAALLTPDQPGQ